MAKPREKPKGIDTFSSKEWVPVRFHERKNADGSFNVSEGFKNVRTNEEFTPRTKRELSAGPPGFKSQVVTARQEGRFTEDFWAALAAELPEESKPLWARRMEDSHAS